MCIEETIENLEGDFCELAYAEGDKQTIKKLEKLIDKCKDTINRLKSVETKNRLSAEYVDGCKSRLNLVIIASKNRIGELRAIDAEIVSFIR